MTKKQAAKMGLCQIACGQYCHKSNKCNADMFAAQNARGFPIREVSILCRLTPTVLNRMQREYGYNFATGRITKMRKKV